MSCSRIWNIIKAFKSKSNKDPTYFADFSANMEDIRRAFDKVVTPLVAEDLHEFRWNSMGLTLETVNCIKADNNRSPLQKYLLLPFSGRELEVAVKSLKIRSASGPDLISNQIIRELPRTGYEYILKIFNRIFNHGVIPEAWRSFDMIFIPKLDGNTYRPISLANNLLKLFEKIISYRIEWWFENRNCLPPTQFRFRKAKSCADNIVLLHSDIQRQRQRGSVQRSHHRRSLLGRRWRFRWSNPGDTIWRS